MSKAAAIVVVREETSAPPRLTATSFSIAEMANLFQLSPGLSSEREAAERVCGILIVWVAEGVISRGFIIRAPFPFVKPGHRKSLNSFLPPIICYVDTTTTLFLSTTVLHSVCSCSIYMVNILPLHIRIGGFSRPKGRVLIISLEHKKNKIVLAMLGGCVNILNNGSPTPQQQRWLDDLPQFNP